MRHVRAECCILFIIEHSSFLFLIAPIDRSIRTANMLYLPTLVRLLADFTWTTS